MKTQYTHLRHPRRRLPSIHGMTIRLHTRRTAAVTATGVTMISTMLLKMVTIHLRLKRRRLDLQNRILKSTLVDQAQLPYLLHRLQAQAHSFDSLLFLGNLLKRILTTFFEECLITLAT